MKINCLNISSAESVGRGHPDKICDQIADEILVQCLRQNPHSRVACEVMASNRLILIGGEITTNGYVDVVKASWKVLLNLNYNENDFTIISNINKQSDNLNATVSLANNLVCAGDQAIVYGFATNETIDYLPLAYCCARDLIMQATSLVQSNQLAWAKYDMKALVTLHHEQNQFRLDSVIFSIQHDSSITQLAIQKAIEVQVFEPILHTKYKLNKDYKKIINNGGTFVIGGPIADTGLTNRKLMVDSYGGLALHGGGGYSGKDPSKVDRTGAYLARWIAKNLVAAKICKWVEVKLVYAIKETAPVEIGLRYNTDCHYTHVQLIRAIKHVFPFELNAVIAALKLHQIDYASLAWGGHFGHRPGIEMPWESIELATQLRKALN